MVTQTNKEAFVVDGGGGGCGGSHVRDRGRGKKSIAESHIRPPPVVGSALMAPRAGIEFLFCSTQEVLSGRTEQKCEETFHINSLENCASGKVCNCS